MQTQNAICNSTTVIICYHQYIFKYFFRYNKKWGDGKALSSRLRVKMNEMTLEQYLKKLRKSCNYSQEFVASHLNITRQTYSHYETGRINPPINSLYNLAKLYGISVDNFLDLAVTYNINDDFTPDINPHSVDMTDELDDFLEYINAPENSKKFKNLDRHEKLLLYYYSSLDARDQNDILTFMKVKRQNRASAYDNAGPRK